MMAVTMDIDEAHPVAALNSCGLPPQLLALVLARLDPAERLGRMATVCSAWRTAAVLATTSISTVWGPYQDGSDQGQLTALSSWLQAHAAAAAVDSLTVKGYTYADPPTLKLAVQQLASLRSLDLTRVTVKVSRDMSVHDVAAATDLPPELSAITRLRLWDCSVGLSTLPAFTNLQHLALRGSANPQETPSSSPEFSGLVHLTHLHLAGGYAQDAVLGSVGALTSLQELRVQGDLDSAEGLATLPVSLTKLILSGDGMPQARPIQLSIDSTPAIASLTALQWLEVDCAAGFGAALLRDMSSLQHLAVRRTPLLAAAPAAGGGGDAAGAGLAALAGLTQLQHLELPQKPDQLAAALTAGDVAALTASSQLTCLIIDQGLVDEDLYRHMFPNGRQLPALKELRATKGLLSTEWATQAMVRCCPNLERLDVGTAMPHGVLFEMVEITDGWGCTIRWLYELESLTALVLNVKGEGTEVTFWKSLAHLTGLKDLHMKEQDILEFGDIVALTSCQELTCLQVSHDFFNDDLPVPYHISYIKSFEMKTPEGQAPDIWRRLPCEALHAAVQHYKDAPNFGWDVEGTFSSLLSMTRVAAEHSLMLNVEANELRKEVASLRKELAEQKGKQQEEVAGLQATVAAMGAQLQALLQQNGMQQG